jgi:hypothetical protein
LSSETGIMEQPYYTYGVVLQKPIDSQSN